MNSNRFNSPQEALAFNKAIALDPSSDMAWFNRGVLLEAQQDARGARQAFQICLDLNPDHAPATANLAILLNRIGDEAGAATMARRGLEFSQAIQALPMFSTEPKVHQLKKYLMRLNQLSRRPHIKNHA